jgi:MFS family permease
MNGWFILPNWVFYYSQFITIPQVGLIDGLSKLVAVFLEVPSGAISDLIGKKKTLILGNACFSLCCLLLIRANTFNELLLGNIIMFIGFAFISGSKEAILYDSLLDIQKEKHYDEVIGKVNSLAMLATIGSIFGGGLLYKFSPQFTFIAWFVFSGVAITLLSFMKEPFSDEGHITYTAYLSKLKSGVSSIFTQPKLSFVLPVLFFSMLIKSYEGVIRQNTGAYFGFTGETFGYMLALISIPTLIVSYKYNKIVAFFKTKVEFLFIFFYLIGFGLVYLTSNLYWGVASFLSVYVAQEIVKPYLITLINKNTDSKHRATALSTVSLFSEFPYMLLVIFFGTIITITYIKYLYLIFLLALIGYLVARYTTSKNIRPTQLSTSLKTEKEPVFSQE